MSVQRWQCAGCGCYGQRRPKGLDSSGFSPKALERLLDLCIRLPYREAQAACPEPAEGALEIQGLRLEVSHCERLSQRYGACCLQLAEQYFDSLGQEALVRGAGEVKVVQADGVREWKRTSP